MPFNGDYDGSIMPMLEQLRSASDLEGLAIIDLSRDAEASPIVYCLGAAGDETVARGQALLQAHTDRPSHVTAPDHRPILACPWILPPSRPGGLLLWRAPHSKPWVDSDYSLAAGMAALLRTTIGAGLGQVGIDRLTGLPNRRWFLDETDRHIDRLDTDDMVGTLVLVDIDNLRGADSVETRKVLDKILIRTASYLRAMVRASDVVARVGTSQFAMWLDGMDHLTAAERGESLCTRRLFQDLPDADDITLSIGIASRAPNSGEDVRTLLRRAHMAAREVKAGGGGGWRVSHPETAPRYSSG